MRSFKKMAREKKVKVLTFVIFLCSIVWFRKVKAIDVPKLKHVIRDGSDGGLEGVCIASERDVYFATDWSYPLDENWEIQPQIDTYFVPNLKSDFDCNFEKGQTCVDKWKSNIWGLSEESDKTRDPFFDYRWEDLETHYISKDTPLINRRIDIHQNITITLSIRSNNGVKVLLCEGYLPHKYQCYTIILGVTNGSDVYILNSKNETLKTYLYQNPIFSFDQWKTFQISLLSTGEIILKDLTENIEVFNVLDKQPLNVLFLFMESEKASLWKVHQNDFLFTNLSTNTTFGPSIKTFSKNLHICLLLSMCENCTINFYSQDEQKQIKLLTTNDIQLDKWKLLKININNYTQDQLQLITETKGPENGYWMIDNVRMCSEKEVKIKVLKNKKESVWKMTDDEISCHALSKQQWRPKPYVLKYKDVEQKLTVNTEEFVTSVNLSWKPQKIGDDQLPFILKYRGYDLCEKNYVLKNASLDRIKSNATILIDGNKITVNDLVPYTHYSFLLEHLIYEDITQGFPVNTKELDYITEWETPRNIKIIYPTVNQTKIIHQPPSCNDLFGRILYKYTLGNFKPIINANTEVVYNNLAPFTNYTLKIETSRTFFNNNFPKITTYYNFTTKPDVAHPVSHLEVYETTKNSIGLRYKPSTIITGIPETVLVTYCNGLIRNRCNSIFENVTKCTQYPDMFCIVVKNLIRGQTYVFKLSIKNKDTHRYGDDVNIKTIIELKSPGVISNLTYSVINCSETAEYCNFNISWSHPWHQISYITAFEIELIEIGTNHKGLSDIYSIDGEYKPTYHHIISYLPYATSYKISVRAINNRFKGDYVSIEGKIDHIGDHIDQIPNIQDVTPNSFLIQIPSLDARIDKATLTIIVQNHVLEHIDQEMWTIADGKLCKDVGQTWIAKVVEFSNEDKIIVIGDGTTEFSEVYKRNILNKELLPDEEYCLTYVIHNVYKNITHTKTYHWLEKTLPEAAEIKESNTAQTVVIVLTIFILFVIIALVLFRYRYRLNCRRHLQEGEHIYEGIPFDNYIDVSEAVYNSTYDKLIHN